MFLNIVDCGVYLNMFVPSRYMISHWALIATDSDNEARNASGWYFASHTAIGRKLPRDR